MGSSFSETLDSYYEPSSWSGFWSLVCVTCISSELVYEHSSKRTGFPIPIDWLRPMDVGDWVQGVYKFVNISLIDLRLNLMKRGYALLKCTVSLNENRFSIRKYNIFIWNKLLSSDMSNCLNILITSLIHDIGYIKYLRYTVIHGRAKFDPVFLSY